MGVADYGMDRHIWDIEPAMLPTLKKLNLSIQILFGVSVTLPKISMLWFYRRLVCKPSSLTSLSRLYDRLTVGLILFLSAFIVATSLVMIFQCRSVLPLCFITDADVES
jgi:hypothetical protein